MSSISWATIRKPWSSATRLSTSPFRPFLRDSGAHTHKIGTCWVTIIYSNKHSQRNFQRHFPSSTILPVFGIHGVQRMLSTQNPLEFIIFRIKTAVFGCAPVSPHGRASYEISNKKQCFQHVRPPTSRTEFHHSSMAMMTCQLSPCERYHPVRRWWNHFIIYKSHPSTVMLKIPYGFKKYSLHSNTACQFKMWPATCGHHRTREYCSWCNLGLRRKTSRQVLEV